MEKERDVERGVMILIAEDDDDDFFLTGKALRDCGFRGPIQRAKDGEDLMRMLRQREFNAPGRAIPTLLILDLNMPRKNGREALEEIKGNSELRMIPVVVLTTSTDEADVSSSFRLGANAFIRKPDSFEQFVDFMGSLKRFWTEINVWPNSTKMRSA